MYIHTYTFVIHTLYPCTRKTFKNTSFECLMHNLNAFLLCHVVKYALFVRTHTNICVRNLSVNERARWIRREDWGGGLLGRGLTASALAPKPSADTTIPVSPSFLLPQKSYHTESYYGRQMALLGRIVLLWTFFLFSQNDQMSCDWLVIIQHNVCSWKIL